MSPRAAGFLLTSDDTGRVLLMLRSLDGGSPATWGIPGGRLEKGERAAQAAVRELEEETGYDGPFEVDGEMMQDGYLVYLARVPTEFEAVLDQEHIDAGWFDHDDPPVPLHRGVGDALARLGRRIVFQPGAVS
ncbi:MAG TPA: NUDIX domain-containing protein [Myxococcota bacterium]